MFGTLKEKEKTEEYLSVNEGSIAQSERFKKMEKETQPFIMSIVTPQMKRVHEMILHGLFLFSRVTARV